MELFSKFQLSSMSHKLCSQLIAVCHVEMTHGGLLSHVDSKLMTLYHCQSCYAQVHFYMTPLLYDSQSHNLLKSQNFIAAKFSTVTLHVVGNCIYFVACVYCVHA